MHDKWSLGSDQPLATWLRRREREGRVLRRGVLMVGSIDRLELVKGWY